MMFLWYTVYHWFEIHIHTEMNTNVDEIYIYTVYIRALIHRRICTIIVLLLLVFWFLNSIIMIWDFKHSAII